jgi:hypothetical protein
MNPACLSRPGNQNDSGWPYTMLGIAGWILSLPAANDGPGSSPSSALNPIAPTLAYQENSLQKFRIFELPPKPIFTRVFRQLACFEVAFSTLTIAVFFGNQIKVF